MDLKLPDPAAINADKLVLQFKKELPCLSAECHSFRDILGDSASMKAAKALAAKAAPNDFPVLVTGETGTGKEVFSNAIHYASNRKNKPLVRINCAAIPVELLESELFGYADGAFTGARKGGKKGKFELANGGTLFLDEIGDMPPAMQAKLLRALQEKEVEQLGGEQPIKVNVRIVAATNSDLEKEVIKKRFRMDLFYRLNVISITLPPLREHPEDIGLLADHFLGTLNEKYHSQVTIAEEARLLLYRYPWPGNVRELKNIIERCYALQESGTITPSLIPPSIRFAQTPLRGIGTELMARLNANHNLSSIMDSLEREIILTTAKRNRGNLLKTACELGIHRATLYKKLGKYGLDRSDFE